LGNKAVNIVRAKTKLKLNHMNSLEYVRSAREDEDKVDDECANEISFH